MKVEEPPSHMRVNNGVSQEHAEEGSLEPLQGDNSIPTVGETTDSSQSPRTISESYLSSQQSTQELSNVGEHNVNFNVRHPIIQEAERIRLSETDPSQPWADADVIDSESDSLFAWGAMSTLTSANASQQEQNSADYSRNDSIMHSPNPNTEDDEEENPEYSQNTSQHDPEHPCTKPVPLAVTIFPPIPEILSTQSYKHIIRPVISALTVLLITVGSLVASRSGHQQPGPLSRENMAKKLHSMHNSLNMKVLLESGTQRSPQSQAVDWLVEHQNSIDIASKFLLEQFAVVTFCISSRLSSFPFSNNSNICDWNNNTSMKGIFCNEANTHIESINISINKFRSTNATNQTSSDQTSSDQPSPFINEADPTNDLYENKNPGRLPTELGLLSDLISLDLPNNRIVGNLPHEIISLKKLKILNLTGNAIKDQFPELSEFSSSLVSIDLAKNMFSGSLNVSKGASHYLTNLEELLLSKNFLFGTIPTELGQLSGISTIDLSLNYLKGTIPTEFGFLSKITGLYIVDNQLSGTLPTELGLVTSLEVIHFGLNKKLSGPIPIDFRHLTNLRYIDFNENRLTGSLPTELGYLTKLSLINFSGNKFKGTIPTELGNLFNLRAIRCADNHLTGSIPTELGHLCDAKYIDLDGNKLSGTIPSELSNLLDLRWLSLSSNGLRGSIPRDLSRLQNLTILDLDYNHELDGPMPTYLKSLTSLTILDTSITGDMDIIACRNHMSSPAMWANCLGDSPVNCTCCQYCCDIHGEICSGTQARNQHSLFEQTNWEEKTQC